MEEIITLLKIIDERIDLKKIQYAATVIAVREFNDMATVKFPNSSEEYEFLNKSGEIISVGDSVYVYSSDGDLTNGFINFRFGSPNCGDMYMGGTIKEGTITSELISVTGIKADKIIGGTLVLGGNENVSGVATVKDDEGNDVVTIDKNGILVDQGSYKVKESTGMEIQIGTLTNKLYNSSFTSLDMANTFSYVTYDSPIVSLDGYWGIVGDIYQAQLPSGITVRTGANISVNNENYAYDFRSYQDFYVGEEKTYSLTSFVTPHYMRNTAGDVITARMTIGFYDINDTLIGSTQNIDKIITSSYIENTSMIKNMNQEVRFGETFTTPTGTVRIKIELKSADSKWVCYSAVQFIEAPHPLAYLYDQRIEIGKLMIANENTTGMIGMFPSSYVPYGWIKANGAAVSRTAYSKLYTIIGNKYGSGDGTTTFNLPDLRGEFIRGWDDGRGKDLDRVLGSTQSQSIKSHNHVYETNIQHSDGETVNGESLQSGLQIGGKRRYSDITQYTGDTETRPTNVALLACIKY